MSILLETVEHKQFFVACIDSATRFSPSHGPSLGIKNTYLKVKCMQVEY